MQKTWIKEGSEWVSMLAFIVCVTLTVSYKNKLIRLEKEIDSLNRIVCDINLMLIDNSMMPIIDWEKMED